jgi:hypothetical protein
VEFANVGWDFEHQTLDVTARYPVRKPPHTKANTQHAKTEAHQDQLYTGGSSIARKCMSPSLHMQFCQH